ncbi:MAG TPA: metal ABC transporter permease [Miltoncostaeaceae bacterium]|nr:metal ABC transporter permease [Miltoncostaeaceae bacterium]
MSDHLVIVLTAGLVATACGLLGPFLVVRRIALMGDAVSHAVLPGIVAVFVLFGTRAPLPVILGAATLGVVCVLLVDALRGTGLVRQDAAIGLVFPMLFALGVLGVHRYAESAHIDLDATIYGEIAFAPFRVWEVGDLLLARSAVIMGAVVALNLMFVLLFWKELRSTSFDPDFARTAGFSPALVTRLLLVGVAVTAVTAFESVGAILVVTLLIVPAAAARLLVDRMAPLVMAAVAIGWASAIGGEAVATRLDASIAGSMGLVAGVLFLCALVAGPRGLVARAVARRRRPRPGPLLAAGAPGARPPRAGGGAD